MKQKLLNFLQINADDVDNYYIEPDEGHSILKSDSTLFELSPDEFLEYAEQDSISKDIRGSINALTNTKRAIECQCDIIHFSLGIPYKKLDFPTKLENIQKMGILAKARSSKSSIFTRINKIRVNLEHYYKKPDSDRVVDAIEIAQLFLAVTTLSLNNVTCHFYIIYENNESNLGLSPSDYWRNGISISYVDKENHFKLSNPKTQNTLIISGSSKNELDTFLGLINLSVNVGKMQVIETTNQKRLFKQFYTNLIED